MIYNQTSSKRVIAKVFRDFGIQRNHWINDAIEWIGEALELIGTTKQTVDKVRIVQSNNFRVAKPKDLYSLETIRYAENTSDMQPDMDEFKYVLSEQSAGRHSGLYEEKQPENLHSRETYFHQGNFIKFSFEDKWVAIEYKAFPLDDDGYPLIPDAAEFTEALSWYIMSKLLLQGKKHPVINYKVADQKWERNCVRARNAMNIPDKGQYRNFKEKWVTMVPRYDRNMQQLEDAVTAENVVDQSFSNNLQS